MEEGESIQPFNQGLKSSIFGPEKSQLILTSLKETYPEERYTVISEFLKKEAKERDRPIKRKKWGDASNIVTPACVHLEEIIKGKELNNRKDLEALKRSFEDSKTGHSNLGQRKEMAKIYLELRSLLCPELPLGDFSLETNPPLDH